MLYLGAPLPVQKVEIRDSAGMLADAGTMTLTVYLPNGSTASPGFTHTVPGIYVPGVYVPSAAGHYRTEWVTSGTNTTNPFVDDFDVVDPAGYPRLVSLAEAKAYVGLKGTVGDALLDLMVSWASARIGAQLAAVKQTYTETVTSRGDDCALHLAHRPVRQVTALAAVSPWGSAPDVSQVWVANPRTGRVEGLALYGTYTVTYTAGPDTVSPGVDGAVLALVQHWWDQSQAHGSSTYGDTGFVPDFKGLPFAVRNKLDTAAPAWGAA
jgi:hypothetical protein